MNDGERSTIDAILSEMRSTEGIDTPARDAYLSRGFTFADAEEVAAASGYSEVWVGKLHLGVDF